MFLQKNQFIDDQEDETSYPQKNYDFLYDKDDIEDVNPFANKNQQQFYTTVQQQNDNPMKLAAQKSMGSEVNQFAIVQPTQQRPTTASVRNQKYREQMAAIKQKQLMKNQISKVQTNQFKQQSQFNPTYQVDEDKLLESLVKQNNASQYEPGQLADSNNLPKLSNQSAHIQLNKIKEEQKKTARETKETKEEPYYKAAQEDNLAKITCSSKENNSEEKFLMAAQKRSWNKTSNYLITLNFDNFKKNSNDVLAKLRSNFLGTEFKIYNNGLNPKKCKNLDQIRQELGAIHYESNVLGAKGPRKMHVYLPVVKPNGEAVKFQPMQKADGIFENFKKGKVEGLNFYFNKPPKWNEQVQAFVLNFAGRVDKPSVKNFQLINEQDDEVIYMQFGRTGNNSFTMDIQWPFSLLQAFAITLSSFDYKIACE